MVVNGLVATSKYCLIGIVRDTFLPVITAYPGQGSQDYGFRSDGTNNDILNNATILDYPNVSTNNKVIGVALDMNTGTLEFYVDNVYQGIAASNLYGNYKPAVGLYGAGVNLSINFGQLPLVYTPPTGFNQLTYTSVSEYIKDLEQPNLVWIKSRSSATNHMLFDSVRGAGKYHNSDLIAIDGYDSNSLISFNKNGCYLGNNININNSNTAYIAWMWKAGDSIVSNTTGSITAQVSANPTNGFSIVQYTPSTTSGTVGHGLGIPPSLIMVFNQTTATSISVYHSSLGNASRLFLDTNGISAATTVWANTSPSSTVFSLSSLTIGQTYTAYCWSEIEGFSKFGSYVGNGVVDGTFVYCGFKPKYIMYKSIGQVGGWAIYDTQRDPKNIVAVALTAQSTSVELSSSYIDILSNGFKLRNSSTAHNTSGQTYVFIAFADTSIKYATAQ